MKKPPKGLEVVSRMKKSPRRGSQGDVVKVY
jgi:hypothetical protein